MVIDIYIHHILLYLRFWNLIHYRQMDHVDSLNNNHRSPSPVMQDPNYLNIRKKINLDFF